MSLFKVLGTIFSPVVDFFTTKDNNKTEVAKRNIDRIINAEDKVAEWENIQAEAGKFSWKDEYWTVILSIPLVGAFIPPLVPYIQQGFEVIMGMPDFYQIWVSVAVLASFGVKMIRK